MIDETERCEPGFSHRSTFIVHRFARIAFSPPSWHPMAVVVEVQGLTFRTIHLPNDAALVARNRRDACVETFGDERQFEGDIRYLAWLKDKVDEFPDGFVLAFDGKRCVGHLELEVPYGLDIGYVNLFYVARGFRRRGVGHVLHFYCRQYFRSWDASRVQLHVSPTNRRALSFYRKLGYRPVQLEGLRGPLWRMELKLDAVPNV
jgi:ribosomal protein S18 acetylase RimI-like enzyme